MSKFDIPDDIQAARYRLSVERPYLSAILYRLTGIAKPGLGTMAVDKWGRLYFDPTVNWTVPQIATVLYHEVCHLLRDHAGRGENSGIKAENHMAWNICCDAEINDDVIAEGKAEWPFPPVEPKALNQPDGLFAEEYYEKLPKVKMPSGGKGDPKPGSGDCGSAATGVQGDYEEGPPPNAGGGKDASPGFGKAEGDAIRNKVAQDVREHSKTRGDVPEHMKRWAESILDPKVNWRRVLAGMIRHAFSSTAGLVNYTYQRPSRRASSVPRVILPALRRPVPNIAVVVDTSGSMSGDDLTAILTEIKGILRQCGVSDGIDCYVTDAAVHSAKRIFRPEQIELAGGGGTDMRLGVDAAMSKRVKPHVVVVLTDGYTPWPDHEPRRTRIVAALVGKRPQTTGIPEWIRVVRVEEI